MVCYNYNKQHTSEVIVHTCRIKKTIILRDPSDVYAESISCMQSRYYFVFESNYSFTCILNSIFSVSG